MDKAHKATDKRLEVMERELAAIYREAQKGISDKAAAYFDQFIKQDEKKKALVADGKLSEDEYLQWRKNKILYSKRFVTLQGQITGELARVNQTAAAYINDQLPDVYALNYNYVGKGVQRAVKGYSFTLIDANTVKRLATKTDGLLPKRKVDVPKDKLWNAKNMRAQVLQGILQGESIPDISKRVFGEIMKTSKTEGLTDKELGALLKRNRDSAVRSARTMVTGAENAGRIDMMHKAATDGVIMRKRWIATTDSRTRDWHRDLDGKEVDMDEPFQNDFGDIMFPGDPTADGANVYNCRCALGYRVVGFGKAQVQEAMAEKQVEIPQTAAFTPAKTTEEAQQYADRFVDKYKSSLTGKVDYSGIQLDYANEMNRAFTEVFDAYETRYPLRNIKPFNTREKRFKGTTAEAAYQWGLNDMFYNKAYYKTAKAFNDHLAEYSKLLQTVLQNIDTAIARTKPGASLRYLEALKRTGRTNVFAPDAYGSTIHEMGHYLDDQIFRKAFKEKGFDLSASFEKYSGGISGYATATQQEYIAESFAAYWKGETDILDPDLVDIFKGLRKK